MSRLLKFVVGLLGIWAAVVSAEPLRLTDAQGAVSLNGHLELLRDPTGELSFEQVQRQTFTPVPGAVSLSYTRDAAWVRFTVQNAPNARETTRWLELLFPLLDYVTLYAPRADGAYEIVETGDKLPFSSRPLAHRDLVFPLFLPDAQPRTYYLRVQTSSILTVRAALSLPAEFAEKAVAESLGFGLYFGTLSIIMLTAFLFGLALKEKLYLQYVLFALPTTFVLFGDSGLSAQFLLPDWPLLNNYLFNAMLITTVPASIPMFTNLFQLRQNFPRLALIYQGFGFLPLAFIPFVLAGYYSQIAGYYFLINIGLTTLIFVVSLLNVRRGAAAGLFYALGTSMFFISNVITILRNFALLPPGFLTDWAIHIGYLSLTLFINLGIALRIRQIDKERRDAQAAMLAASQRAERELERLVRARTEELELAKQAAETANQAKSVFLATMSHELRTPLNAVMGFAQILAQNAALDAGQRDQAQSIQRGGEYLLTLINDILDLAKIESGHFELYPETWETRGFFQEIEHMFQIRAEQKGLSFRCELSETLPRALYCDARRLRQIVINLLGNAVKFTERGGVGLRAGFADGGLRLEVEDTGVGIAPAQIEKIFEPFQQAGSGHYKAQGTGLGLAISRRLVEAMGGSLRVASVPGQGSVFSVALPAETVSTLDEAQTSAASVVGYQSARPLRLLVTDDVADNRLVLRGLLEPLGFAVEEADGGAACLEAAQRRAPDAVFMDLRMDGMDGLEAIRRLRALPACRAVPIVVASASAFAEDHARSRAAGADAYLNKPVRLPELLEVLGRLLPLRWRYAERVQGGENPPDVETLPPEQTARFLTLLKNGDVTGLEAFAGELAQAGQCPVFAGKLGALAENFDIAGIQALARAYRRSG